MTWTGTAYRGRRASDQLARIDLDGARLTVALANDTRSWDLAAAAVTRRHWGLAGGTVLRISGATGELTLGCQGYSDPARAYAASSAEAPQIALGAPDFGAFERALSEVVGIATAASSARLFTLWRNPMRPQWAFLPATSSLLLIVLLGVVCNLLRPALMIPLVATIILGFGLVARRFWRLLKQPALSLAVGGEEIVVERLLPAATAVRFARPALRMEPFRWQPPSGRTSAGSALDLPALHLQLSDELAVSVGVLAPSPLTAGPKRGAPAYLMNPAWYSALLAALTDHLIPVSGGSHGAAP